MNEMRYHLKKCIPLVSIYIFGLFAMLWFAQSQLNAGDTMFKDCNSCGWLNYQFSNTCSCCGATNNFTDTYFLPDAQKRDAKKNKKSKSIEKICRFGPTNHEIYESYITPIELLMYRLGQEDQEKVKDVVAELIEIREIMIEVFHLQNYRRKDYHYPFVPNVK